jgi:hypothetical protein
VSKSLPITDGSSAEESSAEDVRGLAASGAEKPLAKPRRRKRRRNPDSRLIKKQRKAKPAPPDDDNDCDNDCDDDSSEAPTEDLPVVPMQARSRLAFASNYPRTDTLDELLDAFDAGDFRRVRRDAAEVTRNSDNAAERRAAQDLRRRTDPDPYGIYLLFLAVGLLAFVALHHFLAAP